MSLTRRRSRGSSLPTRFSQWRTRFSAWDMKGLYGSLWVALAALMPVAAWPGFLQPRMIAKMSALLLLVAAIGFVSAAMGYKEQAWQKRSRLFVGWGIALLVTVGFSAWRSAPVWEPWLGTSSAWAEAFLPLTAFVLAATLLAQGRFSRQTKWLRLSLAVMAGGVALASSALLIAAFFPSAWLVGWMGTPASVQVVIALTWLWVAGVWLFEDAVHDAWIPTKSWRMVWRVLGILLTINMVLWALWADAWPLYTVVLLGVLLLIALALFAPRTVAHRGRFGVLIFVAAFSAIAWLFPVGWHFAPAEVEMSQTFSWKLVKDVWREQGWAFAAGPNTFSHSYARLRPVEAVNLHLGEAVLERSGSAVSTLAATWGGVPTGLFLLGVFFLMIRWVKMIIWERHREVWQSVAMVGAVWFPLAAALFFVPLDATLWWLFWWWTGVLAGWMLERQGSFAMPPHSRESLIGAFAFVGSGVIFVVICVYVGAMWGGEVMLARAMKVEAMQEDPSRVVALLHQAARLRPDQAGVARALANASVRALGQEGLAPEQAKAYVEQALAQAQRAVRLNPLDARNHATAGEVYSALAPAIAGAAEQAVEARRAATTRDPASLTRQIDFAKALIVLADMRVAGAKSPKEVQAVAGPLLSEAETALAAITARWPLYAPAIYTRAQIRDRQGRLPEAIQELAALASGRPKDAGVWFELGVLSLRAGKKEGAIRAFQQAAKLEPTFANAKWYLASLYADLGQIDAARRLLEDVQVLDPNNTRIADKLRLLKEGKWEKMKEEEPLE